MNAITIAEANRADSSITVKEAVGRIEIVEDEITVCRMLPLEDGVNTAEIGRSHGQIAAGITTESVATRFKRRDADLLRPRPQLQPDLALAQRGPGLGDRLLPLAPGSTAGGLTKIGPELPGARRCDGKRGARGGRRRRRSVQARRR